VRLRDRVVLEIISHEDPRSPQAHLEAYSRCASICTYEHFRGYALIELPSRSDGLVSMVREATRAKTMVEVASEYAASVERFDRDSLYEHMVKQFDEMGRSSLGGILSALVRDGKARWVGKGKYESLCSKV